MFQEHQAILQIAISAETTAVSEYNHEKEQLAMKLKEKLSTECDKIESGDLLKDYSPIKHHNEMTLIMDEYNVIEETHKKRLEALKNSLNDDLLKLNTKNPQALRDRQVCAHCPVGAYCQT